MRGGLSLELGVQGTEPWVEGCGELESGQNDRVRGKGEARPGPGSGWGKRMVPPRRHRGAGQEGRECSAHGSGKGTVSLQPSW